MNHNQNQNEISWSKNLINNSKCLGLPPLGGEARHRRTKRPRWDVCTGTSGASDPWPEMASCRRQTIEYTVLDTRPANTSGSTIGSGKIKIVVVFSCVCFLLLKWYAFGRPKTRTISGRPWKFGASQGTAGNVEFSACKLPRSNVLNHNRQIWEVGEGSRWTCCTQNEINNKRCGI
jgi:hypothetical protein